MIYLYGASGHAKVILEILEAQNFLEIAMFDDNKGGALLNFPIGGKFIAEKLKLDDGLIIAVGNNQIRKDIAEKYPAIRYVGAIHPSANISPRAILGEGTVVMAGVSINADTQIGNHCIINTNCSVDHDCILDNFVHISPNSALAGNVEVGEGAHIGIGACVVQGIKIGKWSTVGAGAVIIRDVPDYSVVVGNPGRIIKYNQQSD